MLELSKREYHLFPLVRPELLFLLAPLLWSGAGLKLLLRGSGAVDWLLHPFLFCCALLVGLVKGRLLLDRLARKNVKRLNAYSQPVFLGRVFPVKTWVVIAAMILLGRLLRYSSLTPEIKGTVSLAVAVALLWTGRLYWQAWWLTRGQDQ